MMKKGLGKILPAVATLLGLVAILMLFTPGAKVSMLGESESYSMLKITFGYKESFMGMEMEIFKFSFLNLLTYILILAGMVTAGLAVKNGNKIVSLVSAALFLVGGIFYFCANKMLVMPDGAEEMKDMLDLGAGAVVGGLLSILAAVAVAVSAFVKKPEAPAAA